VYGEMTLDHDHGHIGGNLDPGLAAGEGLLAGVVVVEGRDTENGYGGQTQSVELPAP
jgi:hypothetical protein